MESPPAPFRSKRRPLRTAPLLLAALLAADPRARAAPLPGAGAAPLSLEVLTPLDEVHPRSDRVWLPRGRETTLLALRADLGEALTKRGFEVRQHGSALGGKLDIVALAARARASRSDFVIVPELIAYGEVRRSWLWLLAGQGLLAGIGHGVAAEQLSGSVAAGWWIGAGEFALETVTWVGGAIFASRVLDPVIVRCWVLRGGTGGVVDRWTRAATRPPLRWFRRKGEPPRADRLHELADGLIAAAAKRIDRRLRSLSGGNGAARRDGPAPAAGPRASSRLALSSGSSAGSR